MWKYVSSDANNISLHDHLIDEVSIKYNDIFLVFNGGFDVIKTHPLNDTGKSKHTGKSQIILNSARFLKGISYPFQSEEREIGISIFTNDFSKFEVLDFQVRDSIFALYGNLHEKPTNLFEYSEIVFSYKDIDFCWHNYICDAWFEDWADE